MRTIEPPLEVVEAKGVVQFVVLKYFLKRLVLPSFRSSIRKNKNIVGRLASDGLEWIALVVAHGDHAPVIMRWGGVDLEDREAENLPSM